MSDLHLDKILKNKMCVLQFLLGKIYIENLGEIAHFRNSFYKLENCSAIPVIGNIKM